MAFESDKVLADVVALINNYRGLERRCSELENGVVSVDKFYGWAVPVETVASMHGVSEYLVRKYISLGLIETHPNSTPAKFFVRGSIALSLDFKELKEQAKFIK